MVEALGAASPVVEGPAAAADAVGVVVVEGAAAAAADAVGVVVAEGAAAEALGWLAGGSDACRFGETSSTNRVFFFNTDLLPAGAAAVEAAVAAAALGVAAAGWVAAEAVAAALGVAEAGWSCCGPAGSASAVDLRPRRLLLGAAATSCAHLGFKAHI